MKKAKSIYHPCSNEKARFFKVMAVYINVRGDIECTYVKVLRFENEFCFDSTYIISAQKL